MEIVKRVIESRHYSETIFCSGLEAIDDKSELLGFKDSLPVLSNHTIKKTMNTATDVPSKDAPKRTVKVETNSRTGEKFIMLNGKKIKILAESELPKNSHIMKVASFKNMNNSSPVKIKILKGISKKHDECSNLPNLVPFTIDKTVTSLISSQCENKRVKISITENSKSNTADKSVIYTDGIKMSKTENNSVVKPIIVNSTVLNNLMNISNNHQMSVQSAALDLTKYCESQNVDTGNMTEDKCFQTEIKPLTFSKEVQTDDVIDPDLDWLSKMDLFDLPAIFREFEPQTPSPAKKMLDVPEDSGVDGVLGSSPRQYTTLNDVAAETSIGKTLSRPSSRSANSNAENFFKILQSALTVDDRGNMPIHVGALTNDVKLVKQNLFALKVLKQHVDIPNNNEHSPLQLAIINDASIEIIVALLEHGASLHVTDSEGNNVLHYAVEYERSEALKILVGFANNQRLSLDEHNHAGLTPLMICCLHNLHDCAEILLDLEADPNVRDQISGRTALFHAAEKHDVDMVEMLLQFNADTKLKNFFGTSPHDAMYEIEDMPDQIKFMILGKNNKRRSVDDPRPSKYLKKCDLSKVALKTYARLERIRGEPRLKPYSSIVK